MLVVLFTSSKTTYNQTTDTNAKIKAMFVYNFTKYIEWPQNYKDGNFIIGILGNSSLFSELSTMANSKKAGAQSFEIKNFSTTSSVSKCHMLIVSSDITVGFSDILSKVKNNSTLIITEKAGFAKQGAAINFVVQNNKQAFELNKANVEKYDLKVSSNLLALAIVIDWND